MLDAVGIEAWQEKLNGWLQSSVPLFKEGKAKEAFSSYPWYATEGDPFTRLVKPASQSWFGLVTTGGYSIEGEQDPVRPGPRFDDTLPDLRMIPLDVDRAKLRIDHVGYDHRFAEEDPNVNLPFDRLGELVSAGEIGSLAEETPVLMGLQPNVAPLLEGLIPELVERLRSDSVEAALLVPS